MTTDWLFDEVAAITERNIQLLKQKFIPLSDAQKSWKPSPEVWSINEIFAHLNEYDKYYLNEIGRKVASTRFREPKEVFVSSPLGRSAWQSMKLGNAKNVKRKFRAPANYNPTSRAEIVSGHDPETFLEGQQRFLKMLEDVMKINIRKAKVKISISRLVRLRMGDALLFITYHTERHMQQAINLMKQANFPKR